MPLYARDVMTQPVETVGSEEPISDVMDRLARASFNGFPVVDDQDRIEGIVTQGDLLELFRVRERMVWIPIGIPPFSETLTYAFELPFEELTRGVDLVKRSRRPVETIMTEDVITLQTDDTLNEVLSVLAADKPNINRIPIMEGITLAGIITREDVLRTLHAEYPDGLPAT